MGDFATPVDKFVDDPLSVEDQTVSAEFTEKIVQENGDSDADAWEPTTLGAVETVTHIEINSDLPIFKKLKWWYAQVNFEYVDLISQLGGSAGIFLIHAESLIIRFALDGNYRTDFLESPQFLRIIFHIEKFLQSIEQCGAAFRLVFFDNYEHLLRPRYPAMWTLRQCLLLICQTCRRNVDYVVFKSWTSSEFCRHVIDWQPPFILVDDCSDLPPIEVETDEDAGNESQVLSSYPYALMLSCVVLQLHVASFFDIERHGRKVHAFVMSPHGAALTTLNNEAMVIINDEKDKANKNDEQLAQMLSFWNTFIGARGGQSSENVGFRELIIAQFIKENQVVDDMDEDGETNRQLVIYIGKVLLVACQFCRRLPLSYRCFVDFEKEIDEEGNSLWSFDGVIDGLMQFFLDECSEFLTNIMYHSPRSTDAQPNELFKELLSVSYQYGIDKEAADFMDSRLLRNIIILCSQAAESSGDWTVPASFFGFSDEVCTDLNCLLASVAELAEPMFPISVAALEDKLSGSIELKPKIIPKPYQPQLLPIQCDFVQRLLGIEGRTEFEHANLPYTSLVSEEPTIGNAFWKRYGQQWTEGQLIDVADAEIHMKKERHHMTELRVNEEKLNRYKGSARDIVKRRMQLQMAQRGAFRVHKFASSLAGISEFHYAIVVDKLGTHVWSIDEKMQLEADEEVDEESAIVSSEPLSANPVKGDKKTQKERKVDKKEADKKKQADKKKMSSKAEGIIRKNEDVQKVKTLKLDSEKLPVIINSLVSIGNKATTPKNLLSKLLDVIVGYQRLTEEIGSFKAITSSLKLPESQLKALMKVIEMLYAAITKNFRSSHKNPGDAVDLHKLICFIFQFTHQVFRTYKSQIDSEEIKLIQTLLGTLGFVNSAKHLFNSWVNQKLELQSVSVEVAIPTKPLKKGKQTLNEIPNSKADATRRKLKQALQCAYVDSSTLTKVEYLVPEGYESEIQLKFMGHQMERTLGSTADPRVKFKPDKWQVKLLDAIDRRRSALVCAPTGCGKTFACYYAMEKVLSFDDESVLVYICPSKALVQQVEIEIQVRFRSKEYPPGCRSVLCGTMLKEFHNKPLQCQILLTIPSLLEMMLMSSEHRAWVSRLKYVVLDEIHCIGEGDEEGRAWERLVQLMPCPFIALSATVGNPESFHNWLGNAHVSGSTLRHDHKPPVEIIQFGERYADLSTCVYSSDIVMNRDELAELIGDDQMNMFTDTASTNTTTAGSISQCVNNNVVRIAGGLYSLNPFICLMYKQIVSEGISVDFYLPSDDLVQAYYTLRGILQDEYSSSHQATSAHSVVLDVFYKTLSPRYYFCCAAISKKQYRYYLQTFKASFVELVKEAVITESIFNRFIEELSAGRSRTTASSILNGTVWVSDIIGFIGANFIDSFTVFANAYSTASIFSMMLSQNPCLERHDKQSMEALTSSNGAKDTDSNLRLILGRREAGESYKSTSLLLEFAHRLNRLGLLPALMFNFSRVVVTQLCCNLVKALTDAQWAKYYGTEEAALQTKMINRKRMDKYKALVKHREMLVKMRGLDKEQREQQGIKTEDIDAELSEPLPPPPGDIAEEYDEDFNFCDRRAWGTQNDEISSLIDDARKGFKAEYNRLYIEALERGIGLHHSGLPRRYRTAVESLFRKGYLRVVFSTETLALGINMPCKSTVFIGDSLQLTPLMYRQTSGRAGRRGFDTFGHVIFWEMPFPKLKRLLCGKLPVLSGEFPITPTLASRTFQLLNTVRTGHILGLNEAVEKKRPVLEQRALQQQYKLEESILETSLHRLYQNPLFSVSSVDARENVEETIRLRWAIRYAFRFAIDLLRRSKLLDVGANCQSLAGLFNMLYEREPCNNTINWLLLSCALHEWLGETSPQASEILPTDARFESDHGVYHPPWRLRRLVSAMAFCICRHKLNYNSFVKMQLQPSKNPLLPQLPSKLLDAINEQNQLAIDNAIGYIQALSTVRSKDNLEIEHRLPFSGVDFNITNSVSESAETLEGQLNRMCFKAFARSPFAALSGREDKDFKTAEELCHSVRQTVYFEQSMVAQVKTKIVQFQGKHLPLLSNYVLDFFIHGKLSHTVSHSAMDKNALWYSLTEFRDTMIGMLTYFKPNTLFGVAENTTVLGEGVFGEDLFIGTLQDIRNTLQKLLDKEAA